MSHPTQGRAGTHSIILAGVLLAALLAAALLAALLTALSGAALADSTSPAAGVSSPRSRHRRSAVYPSQLDSLRMSSTA